MLSKTAQLTVLCFLLSQSITSQGTQNCMFHSMRTHARVFSPGFQSNLPLVVLDTLGWDIDDIRRLTNVLVFDTKDPERLRSSRLSTPGSTAIIFFSSSFSNPPSMNTTAGVKLRGKSSRSFDKQQFNVEVRGPSVPKTLTVLTIL